MNLAVVEVEVDSVPAQSPKFGPYHRDHADTPPGSWSRPGDRCDWQNGRRYQAVDLIFDHVNSVLALRRGV
jgi:hypothetical protein